MNDPSSQPLEGDRFIVSPQAKKLRELLQSLPVGAVMPYDRIARIIGVDPQDHSNKGGYSLLYRTMEYLRNRGIVLWPVENEGVRRLSAEEIALKCPSNRASRIKGQTRRMGKELHALSPEEIQELGNLAAGCYRLGAALHSVMIGEMQRHRDEVRKLPKIDNHNRPGLPDLGSFENS